MTPDEIKQCIADIISTGDEIDRILEDDEAPTPAPAPPASSQDLDLLSSELAGRGLKMPAGYKMLLSVHNGVADLLPDLSFRSAREIIDSSEKDKAWRSFGAMHNFIVASGRTSAFGAFDPDTATSEGDMELVFVSEVGDVDRYAGVEEFLESRRRILVEDLALVKADRAMLADD